MVCRKSERTGAGVYQVSKYRTKDDGDQKMYGGGGGGRVPETAPEGSLAGLVLMVCEVLSLASLPCPSSGLSLPSIQSIPPQVQTFWWVQPTIDAHHWLPDCRRLRGRKVPHWALQVHLPRRRRSHLIAFTPPCYLSAASTSINRSSTLDCSLFAFPAVYMSSSTNTTPDRISCIPHGQAVHSHRR